MADKFWFTLDDSSTQLTNPHSEFAYVNITVTFYMSPSTYGLAISILYLRLLSQPFSFFSLDCCVTEYLPQCVGYQHCITD